MSGSSQESPVLTRKRHAGEKTKLKWMRLLIRVREMCEAGEGILSNEVAKQHKLGNVWKDTLIDAGYIADTGKKKDARRVYKWNGPNFPTEKDIERVIILQQKRNDAIKGREPSTKQATENTNQIDLLVSINAKLDWMIKLWGEEFTEQPELPLN